MSETEPRTPSSFGTLRRNCQDAVDLFAEARQSRTLDPRLQYSIDDTFVRFLSWAGNVGALAPGNASIDFRLQDESKVKTLLQSMLSRLKEDLQDLVKPPLDIMDEEEEPESADEGVYSEEEGDEEDHDGMEYGDDSDGTSSGRLESMDEGKDGEAERDGYKADIGDDDEDSCEESESDEDKSLESQALRERANPHLRVASHSEVHERVHSPTCSSSGSASSSSDYGSSTSSDSEKDEIWSATMKNMRKTIDQLVRFAVILRRPASSNENSRVRAFMATKSNDELDLIAFGEEEYGLRENLAWRLRAVDFPNLPEALHERLFESFVFRKMLLKYRERHQAKLKQGTKLLPSYSSPLDNAPSTQPVSIPSIPQIPEPAGISELDYGFLQLDHNMGDTPTPNTGEHATIQPPPPPRTEHSMGWTLYSDTIASHANHENHSTYERSLLGSAITGAGARRREHYNIPKHFNASDADFGGSADVCEYCRKIISREEKEGARWSRHVLRDLKPYICLFPECTDADPYYGNTEEWLSHMQEHACFWKCQAQITELAVAQGCEGDFNSEAELQEHYHMHHQQHLSEGQILQLLDICVVPSSDTFGVLASRLNRTVTVCPMCNKTPDVDCEPVSEAVDDDEIALRKGTVLYDCLLSHLEEFALRILADDELNATEGESWPGRTRTERSGSAITTRASQYGHDEQMSDGSDNTETGLPVAPSLWQANEHAELLQYSQDLAEVDDMDDTVRNEYEEMLKLRFSTTVNALSLDANQDTLLQEFWKKQQLKEGKSDSEKETMKPSSSPSYDIQRLEYLLQLLSPQWSHGPRDTSQKGNPEEVLQYRLFSHSTVPDYPHTLFSPFTTILAQLSPGARDCLYTFFGAGIGGPTLEISQILRCINGSHCRWALYPRPIRSNGDGASERPVSALRNTHVKDLGLKELSDALCAETVHGKWEVDLFRLHEVFAEIVSFGSSSTLVPTSAEHADAGTKDPNVDLVTCKLVLSWPFYQYLRLNIPPQEKNIYAARFIEFNLNSLDDNVTSCVRSEGTDYRPIINLAGGATYDFVSLLKQLDGIYRNLLPWLQELLKRQKTVVPEVGTFASIAAMFYIVWLVRDSSEQVHGNGALDYDNLRQTGWEKFNTDIKRAMLLDNPNVLHQFILLATRAPEIWREELDPPTSSEMLAVFEKQLYEGYRRWKSGGIFRDYFLVEKRLEFFLRKYPQMLDFLENTAAGDEEVSAHERLPMFKNVLLGSEALIRLSSISAENSTFKVPDENVEFRQEAFKFGPSVRESNPTNSNAYLDTYSSQTPTPILSASHSAPPKIELRQSCTGLTPRLTPLSFSDAYFPVRYPPNPGYDDENTYHSPTPERVITNLDFFFDCAPRHHVPRWELMTKLLQRVETRKVCMLVGPPASGKTQLALRFAKETEYSAVFWINGSSLVELCTSYLRIAQMLGIGPLRDPFQREDRLTRRNERDYIIAVKRWLNQRRGKYLLVFDGCEDAKVLEDLELYFPTQREHAHILVTTRTHCIRLTNDDASVNGTERLEVGGLKKDEAMELLFRGANADLAERDLSCAREVIRIVQGHALAVDLIGDYIHQRV